MKHSCKMLSFILLCTFLNMYSEMNIRLATLDDYSALCNFIDKEYKKHFRDVFTNMPAFVASKQNVDDFMDSKIILQKKNTLEFLTKQLENEEYAILIALNNQELVGYCRFRKIDNSILYIYSLSIATHAQRNGIGKQLMTAAFNAFDGITQCKLRAFITNDQAHHFYSKLGFERVGTSTLDFNTGIVSEDSTALPTHVDYRLIIT